MFVPLTGALRELEKKLKKAVGEFPIKSIVCDLSQEEKVRELVMDFDLVINAVPGHMGFNTLEIVIDCGKNVVDIAFFPEDLFL